MTKNELAEKVASETGLNNSQAKQAIEATVEAITEQLKSGGDVAISGFGKFSVSERGERQGRNPATGDAITIAASKSAKFSASSNLKKALNG